MDAWLTLFIVDDLDTIIKLIEQYPEFKKIYEDAYDICCNMEEVMAMFSRELYELDKNTVQYMIDEMQDTIDEQKDTIDEQKNTIDKQKGTINEQRDTIDEQKDTIIQMQAIIENSIRNEVSGMKKSGLPDEKILEEIGERYKLSKEQVLKYLKESN